jgi:putative FmdB family regulatory protein
MIIIENRWRFFGRSMPNYEYICDDCHQRFSLAIAYADYGRKKVSCPYCGSMRVNRRIGRVRLARSVGARMQQFQDLADPQSIDSLDNEPREMGRRLRKLSEEIGADIGPQFDDVVERLERGQSTDEIESALPDDSPFSHDENADLESRT